MAHVVTTFGVFLKQPVFCVQENDVGFDLAVVVVGAFAVAPGAVDLDVLVERVLGNCHAGFISSPNTARGRFRGFLREEL